MPGNWRVKIRISKKGEIKTWQNAKGEGCLINFEFIDKEGTRLQATAFKEHVDMYKDMLEVGKCYEI